MSHDSSSAPPMSPDSSSTAPPQAPDGFVAQMMQHIVDNQGEAWSAAVYSAERLHHTLQGPNAPEGVQALGSMLLCHLTLLKVEGFLNGYEACLKAHEKVFEKVCEDVPDVHSRLEQETATARDELRGVLLQVYGATLRNQALTFRQEPPLEKTYLAAEAFARVFYRALSEESHAALQQTSPSGDPSAPGSAEG